MRLSFLIGLSVGASTLWAALPLCLPMAFLVLFGGYGPEDFPAVIRDVDPFLELIVSAVLATVFLVWLSLFQWIARSALRLMGRKAAS